MTFSREARWLSKSGVITNEGLLNQRRRVLSEDQLGTTFSVNINQKTGAGRHCGESLRDSRRKLVPVSRLDLPPSVSCGWHLVGFDLFLMNKFVYIAQFVRAVDDCHEVPLVWTTQKVHISIGE